jgi:hypothetical protein
MENRTLIKEFGNEIHDSETVEKVKNGEFSDFTCNKSITYKHQIHRFRVFRKSLP